MSKLTVGIIGCGMISEIYMKNCAERYGNLELVACADINFDAAKSRAEQFGCRAESIEELLQDPEVSCVVNLTPPASHFDISMRALKAGKHVYTEKPMSIDRESGEELLTYAESHGLYIGNAPDCFLGGGLQTCRQLLDYGVIGTPFAAQAFFFTRGPEAFHPNPAFFYQKGAGPLLDWGPYYISALVSLFGPISRVSGIGRNPVSVRKVRSKTSPQFGETFDVEVPTYVSALLEFENGFTTTLTMSFDAHYPYWESQMPFIRIFGTEGSLDVPDVNKYDGPVVVRDSTGVQKELPLQFGLTENCRGIGLSDMANAIENGGAFRANGRFGLHIAEVLVNIQKAIATGEFVTVKNRCDKPEAWTKKTPSFVKERV